MVALVDPEDWVRLDRKGWKAKKGWGGYYAIKFFKSNRRYKGKYLHRIIAKTPKGMITHHINGLTLDERKANLKNMTQSEHKQLHRFRRICKRKWQ